MYKIYKEDLLEYPFIHSCNQKSKKQRKTPTEFIRFYEHHMTQEITTATTIYA